MVSIRETFGKLKRKVKESIEKEKLIRAKEEIAYKNAKKEQEKVEAEIKKARDLEKEADRLEKARERGIKSAMPGAKKEKVKSIARGGLSFLKAHIQMVPERQTRRPKKRKMAHKKGKSKRSSSTSRRYR